MSYIEHSLGQSERLIYRAHFPWFYPAAAWAVLIGLAVSWALERSDFEGLQAAPPSEWAGH